MSHKLKSVVETLPAGSRTACLVLTLCIAATDTGASGRDLASHGLAEGPVLALFVDDDAPVGGNGLSWGTAFKFLQDAMEVARQDPDIVEIRIADGVYRPDQGIGQTTGDRNASFMLVDGVALVGAYAGLAEPDDPDSRNLATFQSILCGNLLDSQRRDDNSFHVVRAPDQEATTATLDGLTIRNGEGPGGGAILTDDATVAITIRYCRIVDNHSSANAGAIRLNGGILVAANCEFIANTSVDDGGAVHVDPGVFTAINCTFVANSSSDGGAIFAKSSSRVSIDNSILFNNAPNQITTRSSAVADVTFSCVEGGFDGVGNIDNDPLFVDPDSGDFRLCPGEPACVLRSPCIDAGDNNAVPDGISSDLDMTFRFQDDPDVVDTGASDGRRSIVDMGAYEVAGAHTIFGDAVWINPVDGAFGDFLNWFPGVPDAANGAVFDLPGPSYAVRFSEDASSLRVVVNAGEVTLDLGGWTYDLEALDQASLIVGQGASDDASLFVEGGLLSAESARIGSAAGAIGRLIVAGVDSSLFTAGDFCIGCQGIGMFEIMDGAIVMSLAGSVGQNAGSAGSSTVVRAGSQWEALFLSVDRGSLTVEAGASPMEDGIVSAAVIVLLGDGQLMGGGTIRGNVFNVGEVAPNGHLLIEGDYEQIESALSATGSLRIGADAKGADLLQIAGEATLGGGLFVDASGEFDPPLGPLAQVLEATSINGAFDVAFMPRLPLTKAGEQKVMVVTQSGAGPGGTITVEVRTIEELIFGGANEQGVDGVPASVALGDFEGDMDIDLAVSVASLNSIFVFLNDGNGVFTQEGPFFVGSDPSSVTVGYFDGDATLDLAVANSGDNSISVLLNNGNGTTFDRVMPDRPVGNSPRAIGAADLDRDGVADDLVVGNSGDGTVRILFNAGGGTFTDGDLVEDVGEIRTICSEDLSNNGRRNLVLTSRSSNTIRVIPLDLDGHPEPGLDFAIPTGAGPLDLGSRLVKNPDGTITAKLPDFDDNGFPDFVTVNRADDGSGTASVILNNGNLQFAPAVNLPVGANPRSVTVLNIDEEEDEDIDIALVADDQDGNRVVQILRNDQPGPPVVFAPARARAAGASPVFVRAADIDGDMADDLVTVNEDSGGDGAAGPGTPGSLNVLRNNPPPECPEDINGNGAVDFGDVLAILAAWGNAGGPEDIDGSGFVDFGDILDVLGAWGPC